MFRTRLSQVLSVAICLFTIAEVNYPFLTPQADLGIFALLGITLCFLAYPARKSLKDNKIAQAVDWLWIAIAILCCGHVVIQSEPAFSSMWLDGRSLGDRAGVEASFDYFIGALGLLVVLEVTRRSIGVALPLLALIFVFYAAMGPAMPDWLFPHRGYPWDRIVSSSFLQSQGVFGMALSVMFVYVFLFVVFGSFLEATGATRFIIDLARRLFKNSTGGSAKVAVLSSGLMGSVSGSAVANTAATGTFTIPMMRSDGFEPHVAGGISAAASSGGALMPPIMGAGAYMMLEIIDPPVTYVQIIQAALLPAILFYLSLLLMVHLYAKRLALKNPAAARADAVAASLAEAEPLRPLEGTIFFGSLGVLILLLLVGYTPFRAVTISMVLIYAMGFLSARTKITGQKLLKAFVSSSKNGVSLVSAASCVGIVIAMVTVTGVGTRFAGVLLPIAQDNLFLALVLIMFASIVLGMGLPSAVCYLLLATIIGPPLAQLGVVPLSAHLFIFYFGMMSMVTPPVALAGFTAASIAGTPIMSTSVAAFRFALVGFSLPFVFVLQPQLLMLQADGTAAPVVDIVIVFLFALLGIVPLAACVSGYLFGSLGLIWRALALVSALSILYPAGAVGEMTLNTLNFFGLGLFALISVVSWRKSPPVAPA
ncbi:MAG: TRAP transporter fused permease subunit [Acidobacteria bacterium]|nr:TRAP transporter fused permease subunit [Acidobacteriota bacterium]MDA1236288.1 TRAP transporter fused permease subunit [Acidobacteriota bacterium]